MVGGVKDENRKHISIVGILHSTPYILIIVRKCSAKLNLPKISISNEECRMILITMSNKTLDNREPKLILTKINNNNKYLGSNLWYFIGS